MNQTPTGKNKSKKAGLMNQTPTHTIAILSAHT